METTIHELENVATSSRFAKVRKVAKYTALATLVSAGVVYFVNRDQGIADNQ